MTENDPALVERYFVPASLPTAGAPPELLLIVGPVASGKTTRRRACETSKYVLLDAGELFNLLCAGQAQPFPGPYTDTLDRLGQFIARRALRERRSLLVELVGDQPEPVVELIRRMKMLGYQVRIEALTCDTETALERNLRRTSDNISAYFTQALHLGWLNQAVQELLDSQA